MEDHTLNSISQAWNLTLQSIDLSGSKFFTREGLLNLATHCECLIEINLSNRTELKDLCLKAIGEAKNLEKLWLTKCKSITDKGIAYVADNCRKLKFLCLKSCMRVSDNGVTLIAEKCKEIQSLNLSYLPVIK